MSVLNRVMRGPWGGGGGRYVWRPYYIFNRHFTAQMDLPFKFKATHVAGRGGGIYFFLSFSVSSLGVVRNFLFFFKLASPSRLHLSFIILSHFYTHHCYFCFARLGSFIHLRSSLFTIHSHGLNFNTSTAFLPRPCPSCSSKSETAISVLSGCKVKYDVITPA